MTSTVVTRSRTTTRTSGTRCASATTSGSGPASRSSPEGAIVQAGSTVVDDVPKGAIVGGHPATVIRYRDLDHYDRLKELGRFH